MANPLIALMGNQFDMNKVNQQVAQTRHAENQNRLFDMKVAESQRALEQENKLNSLYQSAVGADGSLDRNKLFANLAQGGMGSQLPALQKSFAEVDKVSAEGKKTGLEASNMALTQHRAMLNNVGDPDTARQWLTAAYANPDTKAIFERFGPLEMALQRFDQQVRDPQSFAKWKMGASLNADKLVEYTTPDANARLSSDTSRANNAASNAVTMRGQNLSDARGREANALKAEENTIRRGEKKATDDLTKNSQVASFDTMLGTLDRLSTHKGLSRSVGVMGALPTRPGSESANFQAELNTFQSQAFLPMVAQLKGMGALSDAEGKKLTAAVGALDPSMGEEAFRASIGRIKADMEAARQRVAGAPREKAPSGPIPVTNADDYAKVPSGAEYIDPNGKTRRKP